MTKNVPNEGNLTAEQRKALDALANGATKEQAAQVAGRTLRTVNRWFAEEAAFAAAVQQVSDTAVKDAARRLKFLLQKAITAVESVLDVPKCPAHVKLRAFEAVAGQTTKLTEFVELSERIERLEERLK